MAFLETPDGATLFFVDEGPRAGNAIVLIHAEPFSTKFWHHNIPALSQKFRVVAYDTRGRGESGKTDFGHNIAEYARDLRFVLMALDIHSVLVVGWSLGGSILWSYIEQFGHERIVANVNLDQPPYRFVSEDHLAQRVNSIRTRRIAHHTDAILGYFGPEAPHDQDTLKWMVAECMKTPTSAHVEIVIDSYHSDFRPHMSKLKVPTQIHWSRYGSITPETAEAMHRSTPNSELVYFETVGHLIPWVEAAKFNREIERFASRTLL
ncbi:MAG: alpha/beta fold hydrolase [Propylenella sp.]